MMQKMVDLVERTKLLASSSTMVPSAPSVGSGTAAAHSRQLPTAILSLPTSTSSSSSSSSEESSSESSTSPLSPTSVEQEIMFRSAGNVAVGGGVGGTSSVGRAGSPFPFSSAVMSVTPEPKTPAQFLLGLGVQILEGRLPDHKQAKGFLEGDHCQSLFKTTSHHCDYETNALCRQLAHLQYLLMPDSATLSLEVVLTPKHRRHHHHSSSTSSNNSNEYNNTSVSSSLALLANNANNQVQMNRMLIEKWRVSVVPQDDSEASGAEPPTPGKGAPPIMMTARNLHNAVRSFLHFSQLAAWLSKKKEFTSAWKVKIEMGDKSDNASGCNSVGSTGAANSSSSAGLKPPDGWDRHEFPTVTLESQSFWDSQFQQQQRNMYQHSAKRGGWGKGRCNTKWVVKVTVDSLPRMESFPLLPVPTNRQIQMQNLPGNNSTSITTSNNSKPSLSSSTIASSSSTTTSATATTHNTNAATKSHQRLYGDGEGINSCGNGMMILGETEESSPGVRIRFRGGRSRRSHASGGTNGSSSHRSRPKNLRIAIPDVSHSSEEDGEIGCSSGRDNTTTTSSSSTTTTSNGTCTNSGMKMDSVMLAESQTRHQNQSHPNMYKIPTLREKLQFETSLNHTTSLVFHKIGLPLTSSPVPIRRCGGPLGGRGKEITAGRFDFDSSLLRKCNRVRTIGCPHFHGQRLSEPSQSLLGSFEESVLNGRIEPVSTVEGFTAEVDVGSSHNFKLPVTVFFYTFCDNDRVSSPYSAHVTLSPTVYPVPRRGTLQVTLYNPMKTIVKMFVINYDLSSMPGNSETFIRQKILFMPLGKTDRDPKARKWLRYLIHLRFGSSPSGDKIYLHKDIRMIVLQKSDADTAVGLSSVTGGAGRGCHEKDCNTAVPYELRSFTYFADPPPPPQLPSAIRQS